MVSETRHLNKSDVEKTTKNPDSKRTRFSRFPTSKIIEIHQEFVEKSKKQKKALKVAKNASYPIPNCPVGSKENPTRLANAFFIPKHISDYSCLIAVFFLEN